MEVGDKVLGKIVGVQKFGDKNVLHIMLGNTVTTVFDDVNNSILNIIKKDKDSTRLDNGMNVAKDGYIQCPYENGIECSIYLKGSCKNCGMNKEKSF